MPTEDTTLHPEPAETGERPQSETAADETTLRDGSETGEETAGAGTETEGLEAEPGGRLNTEFEEPSEDTEDEPEASENLQAGDSHFSILRVLATAAAFIVASWGLLTVDDHLAANYYVTRPGPVTPTGHHLQVEDSAGTNNQILMLTVSTGPAGVWEALKTLWTPGYELEPKTSYIPPGVDIDDLNRQAAEMMEHSQNSALVAAYTWAGEQISYTGEGAAIIGVASGSGAEAAGLHPGDIINRVDGQPISLAAELVEHMRRYAVGDQVQVQVRGVDGEERVVTVTLGQYQAVDTTTGNHIVDPDRAMLGVIVETSEGALKTERGITFTIHGVGGPSAGLAWALEILEQLNPDNITGGLVVAVTGTISPTGEVRAVGGVTQKTHGAIAAGADLMLVPEDNLQEAEEAADGHIPIIGVDNLQEALTALAHTHP